MAILRKDPIMNRSHRLSRWFAVFMHKAAVKLLCMLCIGCMNPFAHLEAFADNLIQHQVKVAFIYNFISFTKWPEGTGETLNLCIHGEDPFGSEFDELHNKTSNNHRINLIRIGDTGQFDNCQIIFFPQSAAKALPDLLGEITAKPILTIADSPNAATLGVMINMSISPSDRVIFEINQREALNSDLFISSKLLRLAVKVYQ